MAINGSLVCYLSETSHPTCSPFGPPESTVHPAYCVSDDISTPAVGIFSSNPVTFCCAAALATLLLTRSNSNHRIFYWVPKQCTVTLKIWIQSNQSIIISLTLHVLTVCISVGIKAGSWAHLVPVLQHAQKRDEGNKSFYRSRASGSRPPQRCTTTKQLKTGFQH